MNSHYIEIIIILNFFLMTTYVHHNIEQWDWERGTTIIHYLNVIVPGTMFPK